MGPKAHRIFLSEVPIISPVVVWKIAIKTNLGKLNADVTEVCVAIAEAGFERIGFADRHMIALSRLDLLHRDPFDRMLIAQSHVEQIPFLTSDTKMKPNGIQIMDSRS